MLHHSQDENYSNGTMIRYSVRIAAEYGGEPPRCEPNRCRTLDSGKRLAAPPTSFPSLSAIATFLAFKFIGYICHSSAIMTAGSRCSSHRKRESRQLCDR